ncbi:MAG: sulfotransferase domain-containing protein [Leptolyngbyaceae cyanobacterium]
MMKRMNQFIFNFHRPTYSLVGRGYRKLRRQFESESDKHYREREVADYLLISQTNCGRTWLRILLGRVMQVTYNVEKVNLHYLYSFSELNPNLPSIKAIHEKYGQFGSYETKKIILLVRDPRDALVSRYHQHKHEYSSYQDINDFILNSPEFLSYIEDYNLWRQNKHELADLLIVRYEDMRANTQYELTRVLRFLEIEAAPEIIAAAVEYASFKNMRSIEMKGSSEVKAGVLRTSAIQSGTLSDQNSLKVRKGKVGGYKEELSAEAVTFMDDLVRGQLNSSYGYT